MHSYIVYIFIFVTVIILIFILFNLFLFFFFFCFFTLYRFHLVTQCNLGSETMLINEFYPVTMTISNPYNVFLTGIALNISVPNNLKNKGK